MARLSFFPPLPAGHWLFAGIALVIAPLVANLPIWFSAVASAMLGWRWAAAAGRVPLPGKWLLSLLLIGSAAGILWQYRTLFGRDAGVAMLTLMLALKLLEMRSYRDAMLAVFLGFFLVITHFFYTQSIPLAIYLFGVMLVLISALIALNHPGSANQWQRMLKSAALLMGQAVPVMLVLFLLFPRPGGPLWGMPGDAFSAKSGLSETMAPGSISELVQSDARVPAALDRHPRHLPALTRRSRHPAGAPPALDRARTQAHAAPGRAPRRGPRRAAIAATTPAGPRYRRRSPSW